VETPVAPPPVAISGEGVSVREQRERDEFRERRKFGKII
jgi:hypothetical protein